ncbi:MAG: response regulator transcription factor [Thermodesulfobacteriota bacterium]
MASVERIRIFVVDDHIIVREGLKNLLRSMPSVEIVGEAISGEEALQKIKSLRPDVVLMDIKMPGMGGLKAIRLISEKYRYIKVLVLTVYENEEYAFEALKAGASGYILKHATRDKLFEAIQAIYRGREFFENSLTKRIIRKLIWRKSAEITSRENSVLHFMVQGLSDKGIANELGVSVYTIKAHVKRILKKLGVKNRTEAVALALKKGLVKEEDKTT